jgi:hypothetical protein
VCCGIAPGRVSQIQTEIEREPLDRRLKEIIEDYKGKALTTSTFRLSSMLSRPATGTARIAVTTGAAMRATSE